MKSKNKQIENGNLDVFLNLSQLDYSREVILERHNWNRYHSSNLKFKHFEDLNLLKNSVPLKLIERPKVHKPVIFETENYFGAFCKRDIKSIISKEAWDEFINEVKETEAEDLGFLISDKLSYKNWKTIDSKSPDKYMIPSEIPDINNEKEHTYRFNSFIELIYGKKENLKNRKFPILYSFGGIDMKYWSSKGHIKSAFFPDNNFNPRVIDLIQGNTDYITRNTEYSHYGFVKLSNLGIGRISDYIGDRFGLIYSSENQPYRWKYLEADFKKEAIKITDCADDVVYPTWNFGSEEVTSKKIPWKCIDDD